MKFELEPFEPGMTHTENSFIIIDADNSDIKVVFYTPEQDKSEDGPITSIDTLLEVYSDNYLVQSTNTTKTLDEKKATISGHATTEEEDFDEDTGKSWKYFNTQAQIIEVYQSLPLEKIPNVLKSISDDIESLCSEADYNAKDDKDYHSDAYKYHGVSKRDFM